MDSSSPYSGKVILVTGASSGIGQATVEYLASKGVKAITLFARGVEGLNSVAQDISKKYPSVKTLVVTGDCSIAEDNRRAVEKTVEAFGGIHGAFINAGVARGGELLPQVKDEDIDATLEVNVKGVIYAFRYLIPAIQKTVGDSGPSGSIVVNSSVVADSKIAPKSIGHSVYAASKAFVSSLVETVAVECAPRIRINSVKPGLILTSIFSLGDDSMASLGARVQPLWGRAGYPHEVASLVAYLLSDEASMISGTGVLVDGLWSKSGGTFG